VGEHPRWAPWSTFPLALIGFGVSTYLAVVHFTDPHSLSCPDTGAINCTKVTTSPQSEIFGHVPVALAGAIYFVVMVALYAPPTWRRPERWLAGLRLAGAVAGMGMVIYLVYVEAVQVHAICLYCTAVHVVTLLLFVLTLAAALLPPLPQPEQ
jgi:uncharacterized membrane protein